MDMTDDYLEQYFEGMEFTTRGQWIKGNDNMFKDIASKSPTKKKKTGLDLAQKELLVTNQDESYTIVSDLGEYGRRYTSIIQDGDSMFRAVLSCLEHPDSYSTSMFRKQIVGYALHNMKFFKKKLVTSGESIESYLRNVSHGLIYGDRNILQIVAMMWKLKISVINPYEQPEHIWHNCGLPGADIILAFNGHNHYSGSVYIHEPHIRIFPRKNKIYTKHTSKTAGRSPVVKIKKEVVEKITKNLASSLSGVTLSGGNESGSSTVGSPASSKIAMSVDESSSVVTGSVIDSSDGDKSSQSIVPYAALDSSDGEKSSTVESVESLKVVTRMSGYEAISGGGVPAENLNKESTDVDPVVSKDDDSLQTINSSGEGKSQSNSDSLVAVGDECKGSTCSSVSAICTPGVTQKSSCSLNVSEASSVSSPMSVTENEGNGACPSDSLKSNKDSTLVNIGNEQSGDTAKKSNEDVASPMSVVSVNEQVVDNTSQDKPEKTDSSVASPMSVVGVNEQSVGNTNPGKPVKTDSSVPSPNTSQSDSSVPMSVVGVNKQSVGNTSQTDSSVASPMSVVGVVGVNKQSVGNTSQTDSSQKVTDVNANYEIQRLDPEGQVNPHYSDISDDDDESFKKKQDLLTLADEAIDLVKKKHDRDSSAKRKTDDESTEEWKKLKSRDESDQSATKTSLK